MERSSMIRKLRGQRGFTLIELMVVIAIIAILAAILVPNFVHARSQAQMTACESNLKNIGTSMEMYGTDNANRYPTTMSQVTPNYLKTIPSCPAAGTDTYSSGFTSASNPDTYSVVCSGTNHIAVGQDTAFPQYNSDGGLNTL